MTDVFANGELAAHRSQHSGKVVGLYGTQIILGDGTLSSLGGNSGDGVQVQETGTVFMCSSGVKSREGALSGGAHVVDVGELSLKQLCSVVKCYNESPWTTKEGLDNAVKLAETMEDVVAPAAAPAAAAVKAPAAAPASTEDAAAAARAKARARYKADEEKLDERTAATLDSEQFLVYAEDSCLNKDCPDLSGLKVIHGEDAEIKGKPTAVIFWAKFAKGDYTTVNTFSAIADANPGLKVLGISCDPNEPDAVKFTAKIGHFQAELGNNGMTIEANFTLAFDPNRAAMLAFKKESKLMSLGVGMAFLISSEGKIVWREQFTRGESPVNQFSEQIARLLRGDELLSNGPRPAGDDDEEDAVAFVPTSKIVIPGEENDY